MMESIQDLFEKLRKCEVYIYVEMTSRTVLNSIICGAIAGVVAKTAIAPAERVKLTFQISNEKFSYVNALKCGSDIVQQGNVLSLWRGHSTTVLRVAPFAGLSYAGHDYAEHVLMEHLKKQQLPFLYQFLAGSIGGIVATVCTYPLDVLRIRLALIPGMTWQKAIRQPGLFHGLSPTVLGIIPYSGTSWCIKHELQYAFPKIVNRQPSVLECFVLNAFAGLCGQFITYPLDVVRRRMQMHIANASSFDIVPCADQKRPPGILASLRYLYTTEGIRGLFKGYSLNILKGPITLSLSLTTYDILRSRRRKPYNRGIDHDGGDD